MARKALRLALNGLRPSRAPKLDRVAAGLRYRPCLSKSYRRLRE